LRQAKERRRLGVDQGSSRRMSCPRPLPASGLAHRFGIEVLLEIVAADFALDALGRHVELGCPTRGRQHQLATIRDLST